MRFCLRVRAIASFVCAREDVRRHIPPQYYPSRVTCRRCPPKQSEVCLCRCSGRCEAWLAESLSRTKLNGGHAVRRSGVLHFSRNEFRKHVQVTLGFGAEGIDCSMRTLNSFLLLLALQQTHGLNHNSLSSNTWRASLHKLLRSAKPT